MNVIEKLEKEEEKVMDHDKDYPFPHRTKLYRDLQTLCSKIYLMNSITNHYDQNTFSPEKVGLMRQYKILAGFATRFEDEEDPTAA